MAINWTTITGVVTFRNPMWRRTVLHVRRRDTRTTCVVRCEEDLMGPVYDAVRELRPQDVVTVSGVGSGDYLSARTVRKAPKVDDVETVEGLVMSLARSPDGEVSFCLQCKARRVLVAVSQCGLPLERGDRARVHGRWEEGPFALVLRAKAEDIEIVATRVMPEAQETPESPEPPKTFRLVRDISTTGHRIVVAEPEGVIIGKVVDGAPVPRWSKVAPPHWLGFDSDEEAAELLHRMWLRLDIDLEAP